MVLKLGLSPKYVLDEMEMYEVRTLCKYQHYRSQESWEQTRLSSYITAQVNSSKKLKFQDIVKFPWEEDYNNTKKEISDAELERLHKTAQMLAQL